MRSFFDRPALLLTLVTIFWAGNFVLGRAIVGLIPPVTLACLRWTLATLIFLPFAWPHLRRDAAVMRENRGMLLFLGVIGAGCYNTLSYLGLVSTEALNGLVLSAAGPMFIALTAWGLFGDRLQPAQLAGLVAGFFGVLVIIAKGDISSLAGFKFNPGDLLLIAGMITWSIYAGLYMFLIPVFGALLAVIFLGERLHLYHALGFAFIIAGVAIGSRRRTVRVTEANSPAE